ncbi:hypothetical protein TSOC_005415 [Tetrabaena socialis]|uniref:Uncharacterized protein n=1 Tax=Tetrabaena socialis TaxID=47790 RepID=A0A2J8A6A8_9CHLO|nr:hypothetical protein TSOC_005415 [Tetrabaena socialis]|eukprot:PNH08066.1 hypothetical protein TSOC_005415 [Tetrabaena socialis]
MPFSCAQPLSSTSRAAPPATQCRGVRASVRRAVSCSAQGPSRTSTSSNLDLFGAPHTEPLRRSLLRSLCRAVEVDGQVARYETFAGRSAMLGISSAALVELVTDQGVVGAFNDVSAAAYLAAAGTVMAVSAALALARSNMDPLESGMELLETVYASLTAVRRSASSMSQAIEVDKAVDDLLTTTFLDARFDSFSIDSLMSSDDEE